MFGSGEPVPKKIESLGIREDGQASQGEKAKIIEAVQKESECGLAILLSVSGLPRSTYYFELQRFSKAGKDEELKKRIEGIFHKNKGRYGVRRIHASLRNEGMTINHKKVQRLMSEMSLSGKRRKQRYRSYQGEVGHIAENIINRNFKSDGPNRKWTTDVSQFNCPFGKAYLSPILDMGAGDIVAWDLSLSPNLEQTNRMLDRAFGKYPNLEGLILHSDMGWQYQHPDYQRRLRERGIVQSMSRKGNCIDNCIMESFFGTLKNEMFYGHESEFKTFEDLYEAIEEYIDYYNNERIKGKTKWMPPSKFREASMLGL
ncbi:MAG TPA: IS3 family transposase [Firmicutes bacterium]|nr:IS3 family transposase [Bacillota bacterium]